MDNQILKYEFFIEELEKTIFKNSKSDLLNKIAYNPERYIGVFRPTHPREKLVQNITQSHEISFGDFIEDIITIYLGKFYSNLPKRASIGSEVILFDQLFETDKRIIIVEQKMRDDHDSTKKRGQIENFFKKVEYIKNKYCDKKIEAAMWFVDDSLSKNKRYYQSCMDSYSNKNINLHLFYGSEFLSYLEHLDIWNEMYDYLIKWKMSEDNSINLDFENDWEDTKSEILENVSKSNWSKLIKNEQIVNDVFPILFPTGKYKEINYDLED